jgi:hypothetical protein
MINCVQELDVGADCCPNDNHGLRILLTIQLTSKKNDMRTDYKIGMK